MENNCVVLVNFEAGGFTYIPGMELCLAAALNEDWTRRGFVGPLEAKEPEKPEPKKRKRTVKMKTAVTA